MMRRYSRRGGGGGFKRPKTPEQLDSGGRNIGSKHRRRIKDDKVDRSPPATFPTGDHDSEEDEIKQEEKEAAMVYYKEPSMYDNLLKSLGSGSEPLANVYKRRQREEEGDSDMEDDLDSGSDSDSDSAEEVDAGEDDIDSESDSMKSELDKTDVVGVTEKSENAETEDEDEAFDSDTDEKHDLIVSNGESAIDGSASMSSFSIHLGHKLSEEEVDKLSKRKWNYKWEVPAIVGMRNCKWVGTREECSSMGFENDSAGHGYGLKPKLYKHWLDIYAATSGGGRDFDSSLQRGFFSLCNRYQDILHYNKKPFYLKGGPEEDLSVLDAYIMHSLNHVFKSRDLVMKNNAKVAKNEGKIGKEDVLTASDDDAFRDHGYYRPKVLILLPLASIAFRVVKRLIQLTPLAQKSNVEHFDRFSNEFGTGVEKTEDKEELSQNSDFQKSSKPSDFQALFGGNNNDHFMIGIKYTGKSIKLYSDFYSSDMIVASPLGLITKIGEAEVEKERNVDYLSSIEVLIIDHADVIAMQNWSHVNSVVEQLNGQPSKPDDKTDIMRIRKWYLDGHAQFYRQTIILGSYINPEMNALFNHHCVNFQGKLKLACEYKGVLPKVLLQVRQIYERFNVDSIVDADDARLEYFAKKVFPKIKGTVQGGVMLFISSYFEFVRVRNFLKSQNESFCLLGEYTKQSDISRARVWFFEGKRKIMIYTERAHFYHRYKIRGIQNLIIYSLPERKEFYPEIVNMLEGSSNMTCTVLFSRFDQFRLERIVGTSPAKKMMTSEKGVFVFC